MAYRNRKSRRQFRRDLPRPDVASGVERLLVRRRMAPTAPPELPGAVWRSTAQRLASAITTAAPHRRTARSEQLLPTGRIVRTLPPPSATPADAGVLRRRQATPTELPPTSGRAVRSVPPPSATPSVNGVVLRRSVVAGEPPAFAGRSSRSALPGPAVITTDPPQRSRHARLLEAPPPDGHVARSTGHPDPPPATNGPWPRRIIRTEHLPENGRVTRGALPGNATPANTYLPPRRVVNAGDWPTAGHVRRGPLRGPSETTTRIVERRIARAPSMPPAGTTTRRRRRVAYQIPGVVTLLEVDLPNRAAGRPLHFVAAGESLHHRASGRPLHYLADES